MSTFYLDTGFYIDPYYPPQSRPVPSNSNLVQALIINNASYITSQTGSVANFADLHPALSEVNGGLRLTIDIPLDRHMPTGHPDASNLAIVRSAFLREVESSFSFKLSQTFDAAKKEAVKSLAMLSNAIEGDVSALKQLSSAVQSPIRARQQSRGRPNANREKSTPPPREQRQRSASTKPAEPKEKKKAPRQKSAVRLGSSFATETSTHTDITISSSAGSLPPPVDLVLPKNATNQDVLLGMLKDSNDFMHTFIEENFDQNEVTITATVNGEKKEVTVRKYNGDRSTVEKTLREGLETYKERMEALFKTNKAQLVWGEVKLRFNIMALAIYLQNPAEGPLSIGKIKVKKTPAGAEDLELPEDGASTSGSSHLGALPPTPSIEKCTACQSTIVNGKCPACHKEHNNSM